ATGRTHGGGGGLVGYNYHGTVDNSYASADASRTVAGGLAGLNWGIITASYATGAVYGENEEGAGGVIGWDYSDGGSLTNDYWDLDTSGISDRHQGAGNVVDDPGLIGLSSTQLQSGLPTGFKDKIWAEDPDINNGFPYLIDNPPR